MSVSKTAAVVKALLLWRSHQIRGFAITVDEAEEVLVTSLPCACATVVVTVDWPLEPGFSERLDAQLAKEFTRAEGTCICHVARFHPDFAAMGSDDPRLVVPLKVECKDCDARGPDSSFEARRQGWTEVELAEEYPGPDEWFTHLGLCPSCSSPSSAEVIPDLRTDAA